MDIRIQKRRLLTLCILGTIAWGLIIYRLVVIQVVHGQEYGAIAQKQSTGRMEIPAERGVIYDRTGRQLAINVMKNSLFASPADQKEIKRIYSYLDKLYQQSSGTMRRKYSLDPDKFKWIDRNLPDELAARVAKDSIPGLYLNKGLSRNYPFSGVGQQLIGGTDIDDKGISGLEFSYDSVLAGKAGLTDFLRDGQRNTYRLRDIPLVEPEAGNSIILTIDWYFQEIVEEELKAAVEKYKALEGSALFVDCNTGEILAAADYVAEGKNDAVKLRAVSNVFEPGSVFKVFGAAAVLDEKLARPDELINCENGAWRCGSHILHDDHRHGTLTYQEVIEVSSNIGTAKMALRLGGKKLKEAIRKFGFGQRYFVGLPGEATGSISSPAKWSVYNTSVLAIGQSVSVTALQLAAGVAAIANGGKLYRPRIIKGLLDNTGRPLKEFPPELIATVMKSESAQILRRFMAGVVEKGTATPVKSKIISIAGKTGTAQVPDLVRGGYKSGKYVASFMGFFPVDQPRVAGIVVLHQPEPIHYGGYTSGPTFKNIAERYAAANSDNLKPVIRITADKESIDMHVIPDFTGRIFTLAQSLAKQKGIELVSNAGNGQVVWQYPPAGWRVPGNGKVAVVVQGEPGDSLAMVDLSGMNLRTAISMLNYQGLEFEVEGSGVVDSQVPPAGTIIDKSIKCRLICGNGTMDEDSVKGLN